jgi:hypothetical protein
MNIEKDLALDEKLNPEYFSILEKHQVLLNKANKINNDLIAFQIPRLFVWKSAKTLKAIHKEIKIVEKEYLEWDNLATSFIHHPKLSIQDDEYKNLVFSHNLDILKDLRNKMSDNILFILGNNYFRSKESQGNQINFIIAITSFILTLIGLVIASLTFVPHSNIAAIYSSTQQGIKQTYSVISDTSNKNQIHDDSVRDSNNKRVSIK